MPRKRASGERLQRGHLLSVELARVRLSAGLSQEDLARRSGVGLDAIRRIEQETVHEPGFFTVADLAAATGATLDGLARTSQVDAKLRRKRGKP
jgi:transcriptional regulator with XRE-family HTH domain